MSPEPNAAVRSRTITILLQIFPTTPQPVCMSGETFANNSTYEANLNALIASLPSAVGASGFLNASVGQSPDAVSAAVLCRGDISLPACRDCVAATAPATARQCPNRKDAIFWNETCMVRYSARPVFGVLETEPVSQLPSTIGAPNPNRHDEELRALLESLRRSAAAAGGFKKVAAGNRSAADVQTIYALVQCTPDLSVEDCTECLTKGIDDVPTCCSGVIGSGILRPSCTLRFENYRFYNASMVQLPQESSKQGGGKGSNGTIIIVAVSVSVSVFVLLVYVAILLRRRKMKRKQEGTVESSIDNSAPNFIIDIHLNFRVLNLQRELGPDEVSTDDCHQYDVAKIRAATDDISEDNKLGEGGFGVVYKGRLSSGQEIAVKRLSRGSGQGDIEFKNEVLLVARLQHRNLVRLLGFCLEWDERILVYEFVENASLDRFLFDPIKRAHLDWERRFKIIGGITRGLLYMHEDSRLKIVHRDLKASNILLDGDMNPKIADFGMARLFGQDETQGETGRIVGTYGYMSPEYVMHGHISVKTDIFSFGVLVLEIVSGQKHNSVQNGETVDLLTFTWENWRKGTPAEKIDPLLRAGTDSLEQMLRCIHMGLLCVQENAANRPTMASVALMLGSSTMTLPVPSEPAFYMASHYGPRDSTFHNSKDSDSTEALKLKTNVSEGSSQNNVSITELYPR